MSVTWRRRFAVARRISSDGSRGSAARAARIGRMTAFCTAESASEVAAAVAVAVVAVVVVVVLRSILALTHQCVCVCVVYIGMSSDNTMQHKCGAKTTTLLRNQEVNTHVANSSPAISRTRSAPSERHDAATRATRSLSLTTGPRVCSGSVGPGPVSTPVRRDSNAVTRCFLELAESPRTLTARASVVIRRYSETAEALYVAEWTVLARYKDSSAALTCQ